MGLGFDNVRRLLRLRGRPGNVVATPRTTDEGVAADAPAELRPSVAGQPANAGPGQPTNSQVGMISHQPVSRERAVSRLSPGVRPTSSVVTPLEPAALPPLDADAVFRRTPQFDQARAGRSEDPESVTNDGYRLLDALRDKVGGMLLLTATPMQLHDFELYSMVELVEPGLFNGYSDFVASRTEVAAINRAVATLRSSSTDADAIAECLALLRSYGAPAELVEAASSNRAARELAAAWLARCHRLSLALVRNRKAEIGGFTRRIAHRIEVTPTDEELALEHDVQSYIRQRYAAAGGKQGAVGLVLVTFQKMLCSSTRALSAALESRASRLRSGIVDETSGVDDSELAEDERNVVALASDDPLGEADTLTRLAERAHRIEDTKLVALARLVHEILTRDPDDKVLIFSQYLASIELIRTRLAEAHSVRVFHGQMSGDEKDRAHQSFRQGVQVLVASEAGGEGRNFQFCHNIVNYDLPWNPMKIEQRIGRVDRVGQTRDVEIYNFAMRGMLDERILNVLERRIQIFTETVGALDPILESFEEEVGRISLGAERETDTAFGLLDADLGLELARARELEERRRDFVLDWRSIQRDEASRALGRTPRATREDLERFCRAALGRFPVGGIDPDPAGGVFVRVPGMIRRGKRGVEEDYRGSFDVQEALRDEGMQFFAMGHPFVEALLHNVGDPWWPPLTALESAEWTSGEPALLVDYRIELYGIRDSGHLISHLVTEQGVRAPVAVSQPDDPSLVVELPPMQPATLEWFATISRAAARDEAVRHFEAFKSDHGVLVEQELERLTRMFDSRRGFLGDRIDRNKREMDRLEQFGTASQKRIIPAVRGRVTADQARVADVDNERRQRMDRVEALVPSYFLRLLGIALVVPPGGLQELAR
jgi:hypothetical protein